MKLRRIFAAVPASRETGELIGRRMVIARMTTYVDTNGETKWMGEFLAWAD